MILIPKRIETIWYKSREKEEKVKCIVLTPLCYAHVKLTTTMTTIEMKNIYIYIYIYIK